MCVVVWCVSVCVECVCGVCVVCVSVCVWCVSVHTRVRCPQFGDVLPDGSYTSAIPNKEKRFGGFVCLRVRHCTALHRTPMGLLFMFCRCVLAKIMGALSVGRIGITYGATVHAKIAGTAAPHCTAPSLSRCFSLYLSRCLPLSRSVSLSLFMALSVSPCVSLCLLVSPCVSLSLCLHSCCIAIPSREFFLSFSFALYTCMCVYVCMCVCTFVRMCVRMCVCMCMYAYVCVRMCVCVCACGASFSVTIALRYSVVRRQFGGSAGALRPPLPSPLPLSPPLRAELSCAM